MVIFIRHLDCSCGKLVSRNFVNTAPAYALMLMFWCSHLLLNFANAYAYALVKTSLNTHWERVWWQRWRCWKLLMQISAPKFMKHCGNLFYISTVLLLESWAFGNQSDSFNEATVAFVGNVLNEEHRRLASFWKLMIYAREKFQPREWNSPREILILRANSPYYKNNSEKT